MANFTRGPVVAQRLRNNPDLAVSILEGVLTAQQVAQIEAALFPPPTDVQKREALVRAKERLINAGIESSDEVVTRIDTEITVIDDRNPSPEVIEARKAAPRG